MNSQSHHPLMTDSVARSSFSILPPKQVGKVVPLQIAANEHENALTKHILDHLGYGIAAEAYPKDPDLRHCFKRVAASFCAEAISDYTNQSEVFQSVRSYLASTKHRPASLARFVINCVKAVREHGARWSQTDRNRFVGHFLAMGCKRSRRNNSTAMGGERQQLGAVFFAILTRQKLRTALKRLDGGDERDKLKAALADLFRFIKVRPSIESTITDIRLSFQPDLKNIRRAEGKCLERDAIENRVRKFRESKNLSLPKLSSKDKGEKSFDTLDRRVSSKLRKRFGLD
jgi:hypothetical protein